MPAASSAATEAPSTEGAFFSSIFDRSAGKDYIGSTGLTAGRQTESGSAGRKPDANFGPGGVNDGSAHVGWPVVIPASRHVPSLTARARTGADYECSPPALIQETATTTAGPGPAAFFSSPIFCPSPWSLHLAPVPKRDPAGTIIPSPSPGPETKRTRIIPGPFRQKSNTCTSNYPPGSHSFTGFVINTGIPVPSRTSSHRELSGSRVFRSSTATPMGMCTKVL